MFNILGHRPWGPGGSNVIDGAIVLDAFLGSGALALEALSRGAAQATGFDVSSDAVALARRNAAMIGEAARLTVQRADALRPPPAAEAATLVFLDPPYGRNLVDGAVAALRETGWIAANTIVVIETRADEMLTRAREFQCLDERTVGASRLSIWRLDGPPA